MMKHYHLLTALAIISGPICSANSRAMYVYVIEYDSNLYMMMGGSQITSSSGDWTRSTTSVDYDTLETSINPQTGEISFINSSYAVEGATYDSYHMESYTEVSNDPEQIKDTDVSNFGSGDEIYFDSGSTYSNDYYWFYINPSDINYNGRVYIPTAYDQSVDMAFFAKASGYTIDDFDVTGFDSDYEKFYSQLSITLGDIEWTFDGYEFGWKWSYPNNTAQHYYTYLAKVTNRDFLIDVLDDIGGFSDDDLDGIYDLITSSSDELLVLPGVPEPSTYALGLGILSLAATVLVQMRRRQC
ncbi:hypothetical protein [Cerasicoccus frondis]|uniref:hypothetical protein n=1 Tax=Cerasicoccus frondis TaxID=490090 RepID=UPI0028528B5B|nr:hypothetical protein [Cerasicoccus frondis]